MNGQQRTHRTVAALLPDCAAGTLSLHQQDVVADHLAQCPPCRGQLQRERDLLASLSVADAPSSLMYKLLAMGPSTAETVRAIPRPGPDALAGHAYFFTQSARGERVRYCPGIVRRRATSVAGAALLGLASLSLVIAVHAHDSMRNPALTSSTTRPTVQASLRSVASQSALRPGAHFDVGQHSFRSTR